MAFDNNNRLNFPNMVDRQLKVSIDEPNGFDIHNNLAFFDPLIMSGRELNFMDNDTYVPPRPTDIATSINSMIATVHRNLKETKRRVTTPPISLESKPVEKSLPDPMVIYPNKSNDDSNNKNSNNKNNINNSINNNNAIKNKSNVNNNNNNKVTSGRANSPAKHQQKASQPKTTTRTANDKKRISVNLQKLYRPSRNKSIAQIKASSDRKHQQRLHHCPTKPLDASHYETQKRLRTVLHQKHMLEEILKEHEKIQQDRRNISMEIQTMKQYLADIRFKLDSSLKKLGVKKLITEKYPRHKKKLIPIQSNMSTVSDAKCSGSNVKSISLNSNTVCKVGPQK